MSDVENYSGDAALLHKCFIAESVRIPPQQTHYELMVCDQLAIRRLANMNGFVLITEITLIHSTLMINMNHHHFQRQRAKPKTGISNVIFI